MPTTLKVAVVFDVRTGKGDRARSADLTPGEGQRGASGQSVVGDCAIQSRGRDRKYQRLIRSGIDHRRSIGAVAKAILQMVHSPFRPEVFKTRIAEIPCGL